MQIRKELRLNGRNETKPSPACLNAESPFPKYLTSGDVLIRSEVLNCHWQVIPLFLAITVLPVMMAKHGIERIEVHMLLWMVIGYFLLLDRK